MCSILWNKSTYQGINFAKFLGRFCHKWLDVFHLGNISHLGVYLKWTWNYSLSACLTISNFMLRCPQNFKECLLWAYQTLTLSWLTPILASLSIVSCRRPSWMSIRAKQAPHFAVSTAVPPPISPPAPKSKIWKLARYYRFSVLHNLDNLWLINCFNLYIYIYIYQWSWQLVHWSCCSPCLDIVSVVSKKWVVK